MTVPMSTSNFRADFAISDAAIPQMVEQANQFKQILTEMGGEQTAPAEIANPDAEKIVADEQVQLPDSAVMGQVVKIESSESVEAPEFEDYSQMDDLELAMAVVKGDVDIKDIPAERITPRFLVMLAIAKRLAKRDKDDDDKDFQNLGEKMKSNVFVTAEVTNVIEQLAQLVDDVEMDILLILNRIRAGETEKTEAVGGISELMESLNEGLPIGTDFEQPTGGEDFIAEIIDRMVETASESQEQAVQTAQQVQSAQTAESANVDLFVPSESPKTAVVDETFSAETQTVLEKAVKNGSLEQPRVVESAEQSEVKTATEQAVNPNANAAESQQLNDRAKQLAEELEMLRNAKAARNAPKEFEIKAPKEEAKPVQTANPLTADSPVVFTRENGEEVSVKPSEIINQTMEIVTKAVSENKTETEYSVVLNPEELGKITVKLTKAADGAISVTIAAENAHTQRILEQNSELMQSNLRSNGIQLESWQTVSESQQETTAQDYNGSSKNPYYREEDPQTEENSEDRSFADIIAAM